MSRNGAVHHGRPLPAQPAIADLDTLLTALYVELHRPHHALAGCRQVRPGPAPPEVTRAELACLAVAQVLLRFDDERHWLRAAAPEVRPVPAAAGPVRDNNRVKASRR